LTDNFRDFTGKQRTTVGTLTTIKDLTDNYKNFTGKQKDCNYI
jgi:hypothetical protein